MSRGINDLFHIFKLICYLGICADSILALFQQKSCSLQKRQFILLYCHIKTAPRSLNFGLNECFPGILLQVGQYTKKKACEDQARFGLVFPPFYKTNSFFMLIIFICNLKSIYILPLHRN